MDSSCLILRHPPTSAARIHKRVGCRNPRNPTLGFWFSFTCTLTSMAGIHKGDPPWKFRRFVDHGSFIDRSSSGTLPSIAGIHEGDPPSGFWHFINCGRNLKTKRRRKGTIICSPFILIKNASHLRYNFLVVLSTQSLVRLF